MGDLRFEAAYEAVATSADRMRTIQGMSDAEVVHALAAASRRMDAYLANVLAEEVLARQRRQRALLWGAIAGLGTAVVLRTMIILAYASEPLILALGLFALVPAAIVGYVTFRVMRVPPAIIDPRR